VVQFAAGVFDEHPLGPDEFSLFTARPNRGARSDEHLHFLPSVPFYKSYRTSLYSTISKTAFHLQNPHLSDQNVALILSEYLH
jgi:hypothetical protein